MQRLVYPSSNALGIPDLVAPPVTRTAPALVAPFAIWSSAARRKRLQGTFGFYADDRYFTRLWERPGMLTATQCAAAVEPNYSAMADMPRAEAIWAVYRKRWLARHWQEHGVDIWVDLYVAHEHGDLALLGVPNGWQRYATRGSEGRVDELDVELAWAVQHSGGNPYTLLVYAGGKQVEAWCRQRANVVHVPHLRAGHYRPGEGTRRRMAREATTGEVKDLVGLAALKQTGGKDL